MRTQQKTRCTLQLRRELSTLKPKGSPVIDRLAPSQRPRQWAVMRQKSRDLLFIHWPIRPESLRPLIPAPLDLDLFEGTAYVGLVPFTMTGVRPIGLPAVWGLSNFHETNVRTYVRLGDRDPGVWFFNLEAANSIAVSLARHLFHLPYHYARMFLEHESDRSGGDPSSILYCGTGAGPGPCRRRIRFARRPSVPFIRPAPAPSSTSSSSATFSSPSGKADCIKGGFTIRPIPYNRQTFSLSTKRCWRPQASNALTQPLSPIFARRKRRSISTLPCMIASILTSRTRTPYPIAHRLAVS